jgi:hypothetical protein
MIDKDKAAALFADGASTAAVARALGISEYKAKKLKPETSQPETSQEEPEAVAPDTAEGLVWPIALEVPRGNLDRLIETLDPEDLQNAVMQMEGPDKAQILTFVLQNRIWKLSEATAQTDSEPRTHETQKSVAARRPG